MASVLQSLGLVAVVGMIVTLQVQVYWGPRVFGHDEIDNAEALYVLRYLQAFGVVDSWCADDVVEHVGG
jgi:hypothetical protein